MRQFELQSELYQPTGSMTAEGVGNQLGRPRLDRLTLLVREAVQNSWDARLRGTEVIRFGLAGVTFTPQQRRWLASHVFAEQPDNLQLAREIDAGFACDALIVYDRRTQGLSGPTRADVVVDEPEPPNFVNFLRNVGHPPHRTLSGGTYGFGKTALYLASRFRCVLVHTHTTQNAKTVSRFMGAALGSEYTSGHGVAARRYTGRHWWGRKAKDSIVEPLVSEEAEEAASRLRLPEFVEGDSGTTIVILAPDFDQQQPQQAMRALGMAILDYCWPKMLDGPRGASSIEFELSLEGETISIPKPDQYPPLHGFARAFRNLKARQAGKDAPHDPAHVTLVSCDRPAQDLGLLSLTQFPPTPRIALERSSDAQTPFTGLSRHVALMRAPGIVVRYLEGPPVPFDVREYAGVFATHDAVDAAFASAEPPSHDDWSPESMRESTEKTFVRVALREIKAAVRDYVSPSAYGRGTASATPLAGFSDELGGLFPAERGTGARSRTPASRPGAGDDGGGGGSGGGRRRDHVPSAHIQIGESRISTIGGETALIIEFDLVVEAEEAALHARPEVVLEGGTTETEPPVGAATPRVIEWTLPEGNKVESAPEISVKRKHSGRCSVAVSIPVDSMIAVELNATASTRS